MSDGVAGPGAGPTQQNAHDPKPASSDKGAPEGKPSSSEAGSRNPSHPRGTTPITPGAAATPAQAWLPAAPKNEAERQAVEGILSLMNAPAYKNLPPADQQPILTYIGNHPDRVDAV